MRSWTARQGALALVLAACTAAPVVTSTTVTTLPALTTSTTVVNPCPDVFCVVMHIDPEASWSDGTPVTAADFAYTLEQARSGMGSEPGYDLVTGLAAGPDGEVVVAFSDVTGAFLGLFQQVLPAHDPLVTSGEFAFDGERLESDRAVVDLVEVSGVRGSVTALRAGEADLVWLSDPPSWAVTELAALEGVTMASGAGSDWEMVTFNQANPLLSNEWVRGAIAMALDRDAMAGATVRTVDPGASLLDSTLPGVDTAPYPHTHDPAAARQLLEANGCTPGDDGVLTCGGSRMSFVWVTTTGDPWRLAMAEMAAEALGTIGVEVTVTTMVPADLFSEGHLFGEGWDMAAFAWEAQRDPVSAAELYRCDGNAPHGFGTLNVGRHCGDDTLLDAAEASFDTSERVELMRQVDRDFVASAAIVPLFSRPVVAAWAEGVTAVGPTLFAGPLDGAGEWTGTTRFAAVTQPEVRHLLYRGAFTSLPGGEYLPDLVIDFETLGG